MSFQYSKLMSLTSLAVDSLLTPVSAGLVYANPISTISYVAEIELHNTNSVNVNVALFQVDDESNALGIPAIGNEILRTTIEPYDTIWVAPKYPYVLSDQNDAIFGVASVSGVNIQARGGKQV